MWRTRKRGEKKEINSEGETGQGKERRVLNYGKKERKCEYRIKAGWVKMFIHHIFAHLAIPFTTS